MRFVLFIIFLLWGWAEMSTFIHVSKKFGTFLTVIGVFVTALIGIYLIRIQGFAALIQIQKDFLEGQTNVNSAARNISPLIGGLLMVLPGYITDIIGLVMFLPAVGTIFSWFLINKMNKKTYFFSFINANQKEAQRSQNNNGSNDDIIEGEFKEHPQPR